jgi:hypothetical protein
MAVSVNAAWSLLRSPTSLKSRSVMAGAVEPGGADAGGIAAQPAKTSDRPQKRAGIVFIERVDDLFKLKS